MIPAVGAEFVARMEDVLDLYAEPHDPARPVVCFDETSKQLVAETRTPLPMAPGKPERVDYEYARNGVANLFLVTQPRGAWRHVDVTDRRTKHDFAHQMRELVDRHFPDATTIRVVLDNLNTHTPAALYEAFPPPEARRVLRTLEFHYTPKHGSWLNMAELEFSMLSRQCLDRASATATPSSPRSPPGRPRATSGGPPSPGNSPSTTPAPSSIASTPRNQLGRVLDSTSAVMRRRVLDRSCRLGNCGGSVASTVAQKRPSAMTPGGRR